MLLSPGPALPIDTDAPPRSRGLGLSTQVFGLFLALSLIGVLTVNPLLTVVSVAVLPVLLALVWVPGEPPVLAFLLGFQWAQATTRVFHANLVGLDVGDLVMYPEIGAFAHVETATWLSLAGLVALALGVRAATHTLVPPRASVLREETEAFSIPKAFWLYLATTSVVTVLAGSVGSMSGLKQILLGVEQLKWATFFFVGYLVFARQEGYPYLLVAFAVEFVSGIGFFSGFKEAIFVMVITYFAARSRADVRTVLSVFALVAALAILGSAWTAVKPEYRSVISGGEDGRQGATVDGEVSVLLALITDLDRGDLVEGLEPLAERVAYVDFFGYVLGYVPTAVPHEGGEMWADAVRHVMRPRILFPDKPPLVSDSRITRRYTGIQVAGEEEGTSFSIGYMAESYVDFGRVGMLAPIFLVGLLWGVLYRYFVRRAGSRLVGFAFTVALVLWGYQLEVATARLLGGLLMRFIVLALAYRIAVPPVVRWLRSDRSDRSDRGSEVDEPVALPVRGAWV